METTLYARMPFYVDAVQVTADNMPEIAAWAKGEIKTDEKNRRHVKINVAGAKSLKMTMAYEGDWVLMTGPSVKIYTDTSFKKCFQIADPALKALADLKDSVHASVTPYQAAVGRANAAIHSNVMAQRNDQGLIITTDSV